MFKAIKNLSKMKPKTPLLIKEINKYTANKKQQVKLIAKHFQKQFNKDRPPLPEIPPTSMKTPFTREKVQAAIKQLQNRKTAGRNNIKVALLKYEMLKWQELENTQMRSIKG